MPNLGLEIKRKCRFCGKVFLIKTLDSYYCCKKCSDAAYAKKKRTEAREKKLALIAKSVPKIREFLSVKEAVAIYGVGKRYALSDDTQRTDTKHQHRHKVDTIKPQRSGEGFCKTSYRQVHQGNAIAKNLQP